MSYTAICTIWNAQMPIWKGLMRDLCGFEAVVWVSIMACVKLGLNFNDSRFLGLKPEKE